MRKKTLAALIFLCLVPYLFACTTKAPPSDTTAGPEPAAITDFAPSGPEAPSQTPTPIPLEAEQSTEAPPEADTPLLYYRGYSFHSETADLIVGYNGISKCWTLSGPDNTWLNAEAIPDEKGSLTLNCETDVWRFHFQEEDLVFDGGSPLYAYGTGEDGTPDIPAELPAGTQIPLEKTSYLYDNIPYILEPDTINWKTALPPELMEPPKFTFDLERGRFTVWDSFGGKQEGRIECIRDRLMLYYGQDSCLVFPDGNNLSVPAHIFYSPMYINANDRILFYPAVTEEYSSKNHDFLVEYAPSALPEDNFLLTYEEFAVYSVVEDPNIPEGVFQMDCTITLYPMSDRCLIGSELPVEGSYREANGELVLTAADREYRFRRETDAIIQTGGDTLFLQGSILQGASHIQTALPPDSVFPMHSRGGLRSGTYRLDNAEYSLFLTLDLDTMRCCFTNYDGTEYSGDLYWDGTGFSFDGPAGTTRFFATDVNCLRLYNLQNGNRIIPKEDLTSLEFVFPNDGKE